MKTIKSVLIGALVALLGSSIWADQTVNVYVDGTSQTLEKITTTYSGQSQYWGVSVGSDPDGVVQSVSTTKTESRANSTETTIKITGKVGTATVNVYRSRSNKNPTTAGTGTLANTITIVAAEPQFVDYGVKPLMLRPNAKSADITVTSALAADWTIWSENKSAATVSPASVTGAKSATFAITAGGENDSAICIASNKYAKYTFNVTVDNHTQISNTVVNFRREYVTMNARRSASTRAHWIAWSTDPDMVTVTLEHDENHDEPVMLKSSGSAKNPDSEYDGMYVKAVMQNTLKKSGVAYVYMQNDKDDILYAFKVVCDVATGRSITLKHSPDGTDPQSWFDIDPEEFPGLKPISGDEAPWGLDHAYSDNESIARIAVVDVGGEKRFRIYNPTGDEGRDGETRVIFIPSEEDALAGGKIWIFYVSVSTVEVEKFLTFKDPAKKDSEATLNIRTHYLNNVTEEYTNKVLFVGTGCTSHDLEASTLYDSVYTIAQKANVDVYLPVPSSTGATMTESAKTAIPMGTSRAQVQTLLSSKLDMDSNYHSTLEGFYGLFYRLAMDETKRYYYDYIVMEFDCQRIAAYRNGDPYVFDAKRDTIVAEWLNEYYEGVKNSSTARIVWIVDDEIGANGGSGYLRNESEENFFRPFQRHITGSGGTENNTETSGISDNRFRALLGLLNPWLYLEYDLYAATDATDLANRLDSCCGMYDYRIGTNDPGTLYENTRVGEKYEWQAYYNDKTGLTDFLATRFETTTYAAQITDNVETQGLSIVEGTLKMYGAYETNTVGNADIENWTEIMATVQPGMSVTGAVDYADHSITGVTENIVREFWTWIAVDLKDDADASFRSGATLVPGANKSSRDPNLNTNIVDGIYVDTTNGEAAVAYFYDTLKPDDGVYGWAETLWDWEFDSLPITLNSAGVNRPYDGTSTNATYTVDPADATIKVAYSNDVEKIWTALEDYDPDKFTDCTNVWARFVATKEGYLSATSESQVVIYAAPMTLNVEGVERYYNGQSTNVTYTVTPADADITVCYKAGSEDWSDPVAYSKAQFKNVTNVNVRVIASKRNYVTETNDTASVVIKARKISVSANSGTKVYDGKSATGKLTATYCPEAFDGESGNGIVPGEGTDVSNALKQIGIVCNLGAKGSVGSYDIDFESDDPSAAGVNYEVSYSGNTYTVTPATIATKHYNSNQKPAAGTKPYAWAKDVDVTTNKCPWIVVDGTNIEFKCELYDGDDPKYRFSYDNKTWSDDPTLFKEIVYKTNVWVEVSCKTEPVYNYFTNYVSATVTIRSSECEMDAEGMGEGEELKNADKTKKCLDEVLAAAVKAAPANRIDTNIKLTFATPDVSQDPAKTAYDDATNRFAKAYSDVEEIEAQIVDVNLLLSKVDGNGERVDEVLTSTYDKPVTFWLTVKADLDENNALEVYAYKTDGTRKSETVDYTKVDAHTLKITAKKFCYFVVASGVRDNCPHLNVALFYDLKAVVKTTKGVQTKKAGYCGDYSYRKQTSKKLQGAIWGCSCETILMDGNNEFAANLQNNMFSMALWNVTDKHYYFVTDADWSFIQRMGKKGTSVEGLLSVKGYDKNLLETYQALPNSAKAIVDSYFRSREFGFNLGFAGFGTAKYAEAGELSTYYVTKMSGNVVGWIPVPCGVETDCTWCKETKSVAVINPAWTLCGCCERVRNCTYSPDLYRTAISGTWTLKYNSTSSKRLSNIPNGVTAATKYQWSKGTPGKALKKCWVSAFPDYVTKALDEIQAPVDAGADE